MKCNYLPSHDRKSIRLKGYDYCFPGAYFVTIASWHREYLFGEVFEGKMRLNSFGEIVQSEWLKLTHHFPNMQLGEFIVMPNHIHGIIIIENKSTVGTTRLTSNEIVESNSKLVNHKGSEQIVGATRLMVNGAMESRASTVSELKDNDNGSPLQKIERPKGPTSGALGAIIGQFKSRATKRIWALPGMNRRPIWQRNYYERIIRNEQEYQQIIQYIEINPIKWVEDEYFSDI